MCLEVSNCFVCEGCTDKILEKNKKIGIEDSGALDRDVRLFEVV